MFRRKCEASSAPASIPWWPAASADHPTDPAPPLSGGDPFGGWPAFPATGIDPTDAVLGEPDPSSAWLATPPRPGRAARPTPSAWATAEGEPEPTAWPAPEPASGPTAWPAPEPEPDASSGAEPDADWLPLLTHPLGEQRFQPRVPGDEETGPLRPGGSGPAGPDAAPPGADPRRLRYQANGTRNGRRRSRQPAPAPTEPEPPTGVTTWLDPVPPPDSAEAGSLAGAFAADYLSWDQADSGRRGQVLAQYLPSDVTGDPALLGWSGKGRQRAEFALPGAVHPDGEGRVIVDVRVRVTPYRQVGQITEPAPAPAAELEVAGVPAVAPAPTARGWKSLDSHWVRLTVPVTSDQGRLVVDTWDEQLGQDARPTERAGVPSSAPSNDPGTADDSDDDLEAAPAPDQAPVPGATQPGASR